MSKVIAVLVNYNNYLDTIETINTLLNQTKNFYKILVIDNCSTNNSFDVLSKKYIDERDVNIILSEKNGGFAYGNNFGARFALENFEFDFFLLINNDTIAAKDINQIFVRYYNENRNDNIGILTGKIYYYEDLNKLWYAGGYISRLKCSGYHIGDLEEDSGQYDSVKEVSFATGCLLFFHKNLIEKVGYLPEEYFMYLEDVDYSLKVVGEGKKIIYLPEVKIWHKIGMSSGSTKQTPKYYYPNRNRIMLAKKYLTLIEKLIFTMFFIITRVFAFIKFLLKGKKVNTFSGILSGVKFKERY